MVLFIVQREYIYIYLGYHDTFNDSGQPMVGIGQHSFSIVQAQVIYMYLLPPHGRAYYGLHTYLYCYISCYDTSKVYGGVRLNPAISAIDFILRKWISAKSLK